MNIDKVRITGCNNSQLWYFGEEGNTFKYSHHITNARYSYEKEDWENVVAFIVIDKEGFYNLVNKEDCNLILSIER